jgi:putative protease
VASNWVGVLLEDDVERYDGLKIVASEQLYHAKPQHGEAVQGDDSRLRLRYDNREVSFSLRAMMLRGRSIVAASRGMIVDIEIPDGAVAPQVGDAVFKARSDSLRRRIEKLIGPPVDARLRPMTPVKALIAVVSKPGDGHLLDVKLTFQGEIIAAHEYDLGVCEERNKGDLESDLSDVFHIFGDEGVYVNEFTYRLERNYFIPKRFLKEVKRALEPNLNFAIQAVCNRHRTEALENLAASVKGLSPVSCSRYTFKIDRIEYLDWIADLALQNGDVRELIFEPKRMFLPGVRPEMFIEPLKRFVDQTSMTVRLALPTVVRAWDEPVLKVWFKAAFDAGFTCYEVGNLGATGLLRHWELPLTNVTSDFTLYSLNGLAAQFWVEQEMKALTLSIEDDAENLASLLKRWPEGAEPIAILYKDTPLFVAEACSLTALHNGCPSSAVCGYRTLEIENKKGERFFVGHEGCKSIVFGQAAYSIAHAKAELMAMGVANFRIDFLTRSYDDSALKAIAMACFEGRPIDGTHSANFYGRLK